MFDFANTQRIEHQRVAICELAAGMTAVLSVLIDRGLVTLEDFEKLKVASAASLDQLSAEARDKKLASMRPAEKLMFDIFGVEPSNPAEES